MWFDLPCKKTSIRCFNRYSLLYLGGNSRQYIFMANQTETTKTRLWLFGSLLFATILLVVLYASGMLRFGLSQQFTYILYATAGLLAAVTCFGLLSSYGKITGHHAGYKLELGGAIVAFVVVAVGGGVYEKYFHTPEMINMTIAFVNKDGQAEEITGTAVLYTGTEPKQVDLQKQSSVTFLGIPASYTGSKLNLQLKANYEIEKADSLPLLQNSTVFIKVRRADPFSNPEDVKLRISYEGGDIVGFAPDPSKKSVVLRFHVFSESDKDVPLANKAKIQLTNSHGSPVYVEDYLLSEYPVIKPRAREEIILDLLIPEPAVVQAMDNAAEVTFYYDPAVRNVNKIYNESFILTRQSMREQ